MMNYNMQKQFEISSLKYILFTSYIFSTNKNIVNNLLNNIVGEIENEYDEIIYISNKEIEEQNRKKNIEYIYRDIFTNEFKKKMFDKSKKKLMVINSYITRYTIKDFVDFFVNNIDYNISIIILSEHCEMFNPMLRNNIDYVFAFDIKNSIEQIRMYECFFYDKDLYSMKQNLLDMSGKIIVKNMLATDILYLSVPQ